MAVDPKSEVAPILSICMAGRDDDYMLDFRYWLETTLNSYSRSLDLIGRRAQVEILVTDWGSDVPLSQSLSLSSSACEIVRFYHVPEEIIRRTQAGENYYHIARACNVGLRRARGNFIFVTSTDQLIPTQALESLLRLLAGETHVPLSIADAFLVVPRVQVPWQFVITRPTLPEWEEYMFANEYALHHQPIPSESNLFGSTSGFIFSKTANTDLRGLDEQQPGWGWGDVEFGFRAILGRAFFYLSNLGISSFHMGHPPTGSRHTIVPVNKLGWDATLRRNPEDWGLGGQGLEQTVALPRSESVPATPAQARERIGTADSAWNDNVVLEGLQSPTTRAQVLEVLRALYGSAFDAPEPQHIYLYFLSWYSANQYPRRFLEVGPGAVEAAGAVVLACPSVQVCMAGHREGEIPGSSLISQLASLIALGHRGYLHILNRRSRELPATLPRLAALFPDFDLVLVNIGAAELPGDVPVRYIIDLLSRRGSVVIRSDSEQAFETIWSELQANLPSGASIYRAKDSATGMLLLDRTAILGKAPREHVVRFDAMDLRVPQTISDNVPDRKESFFRLILKGAWKAVARLRDRLKNIP